MLNEVDARDAQHNPDKPVPQKAKRTQRRKVAKDRKENLCVFGPLRESFCFSALVTLVNHHFHI
jgi:hypothetical protein